MPAGPSALSLDSGGQSLQASTLAILSTRKAPETLQVTGSQMAVGGWGRREGAVNAEALHPLRYQLRHIKVFCAAFQVTVPCQITQPGPHTVSTAWKAESKCGSGLSKFEEVEDFSERRQTQLAVSESLADIKRQRHLGTPPLPRL